MKGGLKVMFGRNITEISLEISSKTYKISDEKHGRKRNEIEE